MKNAVTRGAKNMMKGSDYRDDDAAE